MRLEPSSFGEYSFDGPVGDGADVALAVHSYLVPRLPGSVPGIVDFQDLEWQHLRDVGAQARGSRRVWLALQSALMRRAERRILDHQPLSLFASERERSWAERVSRPPGGTAMLVPNRLPRAAVGQAERTANARRSGTRDFLLYVGTLSFPPNFDALHAFVEAVWPALRAAHPGLMLHVAAGIRPPPSDTLPAAPGIVHHGFVADLEPLLAQAAAVVFPFSGSAGTSLRTLFLALSGVPVVGPPEAFRGHGPGLGIAVSSPTEWVQAVEQARSRPVAEPAVRLAQRMQDDEAPWDRLYARLLALRSH